MAEISLQPHERDRQGRVEIVCHKHSWSENMLRQGKTQPERAELGRGNQRKKVENHLEYVVHHSTFLE